MPRRGPGGVKKESGSQGLTSKTYRDHELWNCDTCGALNHDPNCQNCGRTRAGTSGSVPPESDRDLRPDLRSV